jgi:hypothetical protein
LLLTACIRGDRVRGLITDIEVRDGRTVAITVGSGDESTRLLTPADIDYGFDLAHLREHRDNEEPVSVKVQERDGEKVALIIEDDAL